MWMEIASFFHALKVLHSGNCHDIVSYAKMHTYDKRETTIKNNKILYILTVNLNHVYSHFKVVFD